MGTLTIEEPTVTAIEAAPAALACEDDRDDGWPAGYPDPADYDDETDYLCAIPGYAESIIELMNAPDSEFKPAPRKFFNV